MVLTVDRLDRLAEALAIGRLVDELPPDGDEPLLPDDLRDLRRTLYGLHAILRLHFAQEEEQYLPLLEEGAARRAGRSQPAV